jgi:hypothetical protein
MRGKQDRASNCTWLVLGAAAVFISYSLPFIRNHLHHRSSLNVAVSDEKIYLARSFRAVASVGCSLVDHVPYRV